MHAAARASSKRISPAPKLWKSSDKSLSQPWCSHSNTIYEIQLQKTVVWRMQLRRQATLTQPLQCDLQVLHSKTQWNYVQRRQKLQLQNWISAPKQKKDDIEPLFKRTLQRKLPAPKLRKSADKSLSQPWCSHSNTIYEIQLQKTIVLRMQPRHQATLTQPLQCDLQSLSCKAYFRIAWNLCVCNWKCKSTCRGISLFLTS